MVCVRNNGSRDVSQTLVVCNIIITGHIASASISGNVKIHGMKICSFFFTSLIMFIHPDVKDLRWTTMKTFRHSHLIGSIASDGPRDSLICTHSFPTRLVSICFLVLYVSPQC